MSRSNYYERLKNRKNYYEGQSEKNTQQAQFNFERSDEMASVIPPGQPILIGHHSEKGHRAHLKRIHDLMGKAIGQQEKARYYAEKAKGVGTNGISLDNPDALLLLYQKLERLIFHQELMKEVNKIVRSCLGRNWSSLPENELSPKVEAARTRIVKETDLTDEQAVKLLMPDFMGRIGFARFSLTNNGAQIRTVKKRIEQTQRLEDAINDDEKETEWKLENGVTVELDAEDNRIRIYFPGKPEYDLRKEMKSNGFRWSRLHSAWQCFYGAYDYRIEKARTLGAKY